MGSRDLAARLRGAAARRVHAERRDEASILVPMHRSRLPSTLVLLALSCGGAEERPPCELGDPTGASVDGQAPSSWECLCTATFTADYAVPDSTLILRAGGRYVMGAGPFERVYYFGEGGVVDVELSADALVTTTCPWSVDEVEQGEPRVVVLADVELFKDTALSEPACALTAGETYAAGSSLGYFLAGQVDGQTIRGIDSDALPAICGVEEAYKAASTLEIEGLAIIDPPLAEVAIAR
jgi:hypothetical protein